MMVSYLGSVVDRSRRASYGFISFLVMRTPSGYSPCSRFTVGCWPHHVIRSASCKITFKRLVVTPQGFRASPVLDKMIVARREGREAMSAENFAHLACPNPDCSSYGQRGRGNLRPHGWSTADKRIRCLRCTLCGQHFSARANTPLFGLRTHEDKL